MIQTTPKEFQKQAVDDYAVLSLIPNYYNLSDTKNIETFGKRLKQARTTYYDRMIDVIDSPSKPEHTAEREITQGFLAQYLGVSVMTISKYENSQIKKIPLKKLRRICELLDVTPHYLLGIVSEPNQSMGIDKDGSIKRVMRKKKIKDEEGNEKEIEEEVDETLMQPMQFDAPLYIAAVDFYRRLFDEDSKLFWLINDLICTPVSLRNYYKQILASVLNRDEDFG